MSRKRIVVVGAGGMAREVVSTLQWINRSIAEFDFLGYVISDLSRLGKRDSSQRILGDFEWLSANSGSFDALAVGVGSPHLRLKFAAELRHLLPGAAWPAIVHPTAIIDVDSAELAEGSFIGAGVTATVNVVLESFSLCNFGCTLGHECRIGSGSVVNPGANISGGVVIGTGALIGSGAQILQYLNIGAGAIVGAGAVVTADVPDGVTVVGIPARPRTAERTQLAIEQLRYQV